MVIETERLILRRLTMDDVDELVAFEADPEIVRFLGPLDRHAVIAWPRRVDHHWQERGHGRLAITDRNSGLLLGRTGIMYLQQFQETEVAWTLRRDAWRHGYATEAARACANWAFHSFAIPYLISLIAPDNVRSMAVAKRLGMTPLRDDVFLDRAVIVHAIDRERWLSSSGPSGGSPEA